MDEILERRVRRHAAAALVTLSGPEFSPGMLTPNQPAGQVVWSCVDELVSGMVSGGTHIGSMPFSTLFWTFMPSYTAVASTYGLNEEPTWSRLCMAML